jgi:hypothetical protein
MAAKIIEDDLGFSAKESVIYAARALGKETFTDTPLRSNN